ncbi:MAG: alpha-amylase [Syntrophus sp. (in: bacteria)]|nr:alpha-amylase [Syntrophus sp. (in: bacteria)]
MEFHVSRHARDRYGFDDAISSSTGNVAFANFHTARVFAQKINRKRDLKRFPEQAVKAGQIIAVGLIDEVLRYIIRLYQREVNPNAIREALEVLYGALGREKVDTALFVLTNEFPPVEVYRGELSAEDYLGGTTGDTPNRQIALEEMLLLWLANMNPAFAPFMDLFDETILRKTTIYPNIISELRKYFDIEPAFGPDNQHLVDMLRSPAVNVPHSLSGQLDYIREHWGILLKTFIRRILKGLDIFKEEEKQTFHGPGPTRVLKYKGRDKGLSLGIERELEAEQFSPDREWMPRLVLMAKNIYVWLDQLSKKYSCPITKLDEIPDEELDALRRQGFSGLWLIGIWERSPSSQKIKQLCGNPEAVPSAYSLFDYEIAVDLGGEGAYGDLRDRAWSRGIRLASDMVPNHVGIYSKWTIEHPDWFVSLDYNPFPWYSFSGQDLSLDERVSMYVEDHYYNRTDAAVVFKRVDRWTGSEQYVYHGNDGTSMPWNDTAQLNYLNPEVREAMIRTILHVARKFPVIRFDAAMTLTKKHYQRLWFPEPGTGGDIPTRGEFGLTKEEFNNLMPMEFWREVVDRVAAEAPDTLLLAEAFWLLEGYFVRTLGMHRVYNSAFMNMLRDEENAKYRQVMKNTLEFDPEILRRFVNFMNNPDERTAVDQFGKDSKYFGVCVLMITMPGLPMFGHGQIEGFEERYGMEYRRAYYDESPDTYLAERHEREVFPLLHQRHLFSGVEHFFLYDFFAPQGSVNEDVFAYSNQCDGERILVVYLNRNSNASGWIRTSVAYSAKTGDGDARTLTQKTLGQGLALSPENGSFIIFFEHASNLWFIRENRDIHEKGFYVDLEPYGYHVFLNFQEVMDNEWRHYSRLTSYLNGRGVPDIRTAMEEMLLQPMLHRFRGLVNGQVFLRIKEASEGLMDSEGPGTLPRVMDDIKEKVLLLLREMKAYSHGQGDETERAHDIMGTLESLITLPSLIKGPDRNDALSPYKEDLLSPLLEKGEEGAIEETPESGIVEHLCLDLNKDLFSFYAFCGWAFIRSLGAICTDDAHVPAESRRMIDKWFLGPVMAAAFEELGMDSDTASKTTTVIKLLTTYEHMLELTTATRLHDRLTMLFDDEEAQRFLKVNEYTYTLWFSKERLQGLLSRLLVLQAISLNRNRSVHRDQLIAGIEKYYQLTARLDEASERSGYQVTRFLEIVKDEIDRTGEGLK